MASIFPVIFCLSMKMKIVNNIFGRKNAFETHSSESPRKGFQDYSLDGFCKVRWLVN